jgi:CheY-like chemotaxis protein
MLHTSNHRTPRQIDTALVEPNRRGTIEHGLRALVCPSIEVVTTYEVPVDLLGAVPTAPLTGYTVLVVDDYDFSRDAVARSLMLEGHTVFAAQNGRQALELLRERAFDLMLLDIMMPEINGFEVLEQCSRDPQLRHIPIVVISGNDDLDSVVRCIEMGAADYLLKPFDHVLFKARVDSCLEKKRLRDQEQAYIRELKAEQEKSERLLLNILPAPIAAQLKQDRGIIAEQFDDVTVLARRAAWTRKDQDDRRCLHGCRRLTDTTARSCPGRRGHGDRYAAGAGRAVERARRPVQHADRHTYGASGCGCDRHQ